MFRCSVYHVLSLHCFQKILEMGRREEIRQFLMRLVLILQLLFPLKSRFSIFLMFPETKKKKVK